ncbi:hypothetical protein F2Q70_00025152 [Brassica cretica]|uniref:Uncharacterized protein n=1 Tax=Brassica cretica TaxID=69181 RepID=A0A8S9LAM5_BRACR|nr:hypothetical protein F2Q70_00025152 [Brassica cretica]KAF3566100.1 hypothetical protein DY000_02013833 [Brassica cretica]
MDTELNVYWNAKETDGNGYPRRLLISYRNSYRAVIRTLYSSWLTGSWRGTRNCYGTARKLRVGTEKHGCPRQKYRERDIGEMDRSGQKKMAGRPIRVCNGGRESVCPSARSYGSFHDQFESGDPGLRYLQSMVFEPKPREWFIGVVCTNRGRVLMDRVA